MPHLAPIIPPHLAAITQPAPVSGYRETVRTPAGLVTLSIRDDRYVLQGPSGEHTLDIGCTSAQRLHAHFEGFVAANGGRVTARVEGGQ